MVRHLRTALGAAGCVAGWLALGAHRATQRREREAELWAVAADSPTLGSPTI